MPDELWNQFERLNSSYEYSNFAIALTYKNGFLNRLLDSNPNLRDEIKQKLILEEKAIFFFISTFHYFSYLDKPEFITKFKSEVHEFIKANNQSDLIYFQNRFNETSNKFNKIWYGYVCWFSNKNANIFGQTLNYTLEFLQSLVEQNNKSSDMDICHALCFSFNVALLYGIRDHKIDLVLERICEQIIENVSKDSARLRYLIEPVKILARINKNEQRINELVSLLHGSANELKSNIGEKFSVSDGLLMTSIDLINLLASLSPDEKGKLIRIIHEMIGKLYEDVAKFKINNKEHPMVASFFYQKAYNEYERAGNKEKYEECLRLCSENTIFDEPTIVEFEIPAINVSGDTENEIINNLIKLFFENQNTVLDEETNRGMILHEINKHPLSSALSSQNYTKMGPSSPVSVTDEEKLSSEIKLAIKNNINLFDATICRTFAILESENKITAFGIQHFLNTYRILDANCIFLLNQGFKHHFEKDFVASIHILTPQIESVLRRLLEIKKVNFFKLKKDAIMSKELGGLLELDELSDVLSANLIRYLKLKYTDINGLNFRNNLSHGFLQQEDFNHINSCSIIYSIMVILKTSDKV